MFKLSVLTPEKKVLVDQDITEITVPVESGERQILPGHVPMIANLGTGILKYKTVGSDTVQQCVISWGYCEVSTEGVNILAEFIQTKDEVNSEASKLNITQMQTKLVSEFLSDVDFTNALNDIKKSESALNLIK